MRNGLARLLIPAALILLVVAGCNIFDFVGDSDVSSYDKAEADIRDGRYDEARSEMAPLLADNPSDSYALYLDTKAALHEAGVDVIEIVDRVEGGDVNPGETLGLLGYIDTLSDEQKTAWYQANQTVAENLGKIVNEETTGPFDAEDIALDYTIGTLLSGVLGIRDTNFDGTINNSDFDLNLSFIESGFVEGYGFDGATDNSGEYFPGLTIFTRGLTPAKVTDDPEVPDDLSEPDDINRLVAYVLGFLEDGQDGLHVLLSKIDTSSFDVEDIDQYVDEIATVVNYYWYDDGIDNDGDGSIDEETIDGIDNDLDGFVDEDSDYHHSDPTTAENTEYIAVWEYWSNN